MNIAIKKFNKDLHGFIQQILLVLPCLVLFVVSLIDIQIKLKTLIMVILLIPFMFTNFPQQYMIILFFSGFSADMNVNLFGVPFITLLQVATISKQLLLSHKIKKQLIFVIIALLVTQIYPIVFCRLSVVRIVTFILNIMLTYCIAVYLPIDKEKYRGYLWAYILGLTCVLLTSIYRDPLFFSGKYYRFKGIWTDQNFLGMFCALGIIFLFILTSANINRMILYLPLFILFSYCAYRTYSKTFIFALVVVCTCALSKIITSNVKFKNKVIVCTLLALLLLIVSQGIIMQIINERGEIFVAGKDWTHGRLLDSKLVYEAWKQNAGNILFGIGIDNSVNYVGVAAHNTYVEALCQLGLVGFLLGTIVAVAAMFNSGFKLKLLLYTDLSCMLVFLLYAAGLSLQSTDIFYLLFGLYCAYYRTCIMQEDKV